MLSVYDDYKVLCVRLASREVLMGFCKELEDGSVEIIEPQIMITDAADGQMNVNFAPWIPYAKDYEFIIEANQIQTIFEPKPQLETNYKVATGNKKRGA